MKARFETIRVNLVKAEKVITKKGRESKEGKDALTAIGDVFSSLKLTPRLFDELCIVSSALSSTLFEIKSAKFCDCVPNKGGLIGKIFIKEWHGNETNFEWIPGLASKKKSEKLDAVVPEVQRCQARLQSVAEGIGVTIPSCASIVVSQWAKQKRVVRRRIWSKRTYDS